MIKRLHSAVKMVQSTKKGFSFHLRATFVEILGLVAIPAKEFRFAIIQLAIHLDEVGLHLWMCFEYLGVKCMPLQESFFFFFNILQKEKKEIQTLFLVFLSFCKCTRDVLCKINSKNYYPQKIIWEFDFVLSESRKCVFSC